MDMMDSPHAQDTSMSLTYIKSFSGLKLVYSQGVQKSSDLDLPSPLITQARPPSHEE